MFCCKARASKCEVYGACECDGSIESSLLEMLRGLKDEIRAASDRLKLDELYGRASGYIEALYDAGLVEGGEAADYLEGIIALYRQAAFLLV